MRPNVIKYNLFSGGCTHCMTISYDDGVEADIRLAKIFRDNGIRGTFFVNSASLGGSGRVKPEEMRKIYEGHEVASHTVTHPIMRDIPDMAVLQEVLEDRRAIEEIMGTVVRGLSYPYGSRDQRIVDLCRTAGIEYARTNGSSGNFGIPDNLLLWTPTCRHRENPMAKLEEFYKPHPHKQMRLFYVWGHAYEFDQDNNWDMIEEFAKMAGNRPDTWYATNIEIADYLNAMRALRVSADRSKVYNPSAVEVWFTINNESASVKPGETFSL